jgi:hypothetical protein
MTYYIISKDGTDIEQRRLSRRQADRLVAMGYSLRINQGPLRAEVREGEKGSRCFLGRSLSRRRSISDLDIPIMSARSNILRLAILMIDETTGAVRRTQSARPQPRRS